jgi:hypothetical protein
MPMSSNDMARYQGAGRKGQWPTTHALNVDKHGGFEPGRALAAFTEAPAARNTVRHLCWAEGNSSVCG